MTQQDINEHRRRALERKLNTPSTFADRRSEAQAVPPRQLVAMGSSDHTISRGINDPHHEVIEVEMFFDKQHPSQKYYRLPGGVLQAVSETSGKEETAVQLPPMRTRPRLPGAHEPSPADPAARPV